MSRTSTTGSILVSGAGSSIGLEVAKSLREAGRPETILGAEVSWWGEDVAGRWCDEVVRVPRGDDPRYPEVIGEVFDRHHVRLAFISTDTEIEALAPIRDDIDTPLSIPGSDLVPYCLDKRRLHDAVAGSGLVAETVAVEDEADLAEALRRFGSPVWLRCAVGPRGHGSIAISTPADGAAWIGMWDPHGDWIAHRYLPGRNLNWTSIWWNGELVASAAGERLAYFLASVAVSGITGNVSWCRTVPEGDAGHIAEQLIRTLGGRPHGVFSVDLKEDPEGRPLVTEINGRTAFRPLLYTRAGFNVPAVYAGLVLDGRRPDRIGGDAARAGWEMVRNMDVEPLFRHPGDSAGSDR
jgi:carbamoyl-phosphate synthase large subunit